MHMRRNATLKSATVWVGTLFLLMGLTATELWAQGGRGGITALVADSSGAVMEKAKVRATNLDTGVSRETVTTSAGSFVFSLLDVGRYRIEVTATGFKALVREPIVVRVSETTDLQFLTLAVGNPAESVTVTGEAPALQTTAATLGHVFEQTTVVDLPLATRNFTQLLTLQAGVVADVPNSAVFGKGSVGFSVGGSRYYDNSVLIDGINSQGSAGAAYGPYLGGAVPAPDTVQEFKVQTQLFSAEYGRAGGASVNLVTKSGTNQFHGDVYEFFRNNALNANEYFFKQSQLASGTPNKAPVLRQNQFGGTVGGPVRKNKTFFFGSYQGTRQLNGAAPGLIFSDSVYPLLPTGDRSDTAQLQSELGAIYGGRTGFLGGGLIGGIPVDYILPDGSNINPVSLKILQTKLPNGQYLLPSFPQNSVNDGKGGLDGGQVFSSGGFSLPATFNEDQYMINIDQVITKRQTFSGKWFSSSEFTDALTGTVPGFSFAGKPQNRNLVLADTFAINPTLVNEFRAGYTRITSPSQRQDPAGITAASVGMIPAPDGDGRFPRIIVGNSGLDFGADHFFNTLKENQYTVSDTVSKIVGRHSWHVGATFVRHQLFSNRDIVATGQIISLSFQDFLLGEDAAGNNTALNSAPGFSNIFAPAAWTGSGEKDFRFNDLSAFAQDDFKVKRNLTLNLGLRWDYFAWPTDTQGRLSGFDVSKIGEGAFGIPTPDQAFTGYTIAKSFHEHNPNVVIPSGVSQVDNTLVNGEDYNNFGPRVGFAWQPREQISVRGGYGLFYPRVSSEAALSEQIGLPFNNLSIVINSPNGSYQDPFTFLNLPPDSAFPIWQPRQFIPGVVPGLTVTPQSTNSRNPYVQQWNLSVQHEFGKNYLLEIAYSGSHGIGLLNTLSSNQPGIASVANPIRGTTTNTSAGDNIQARAPVAGFVADTGIATSETTAQSKYDALLATMSKRYSNGLQFQSAFTWSKSADTNSLVANSAGTDPFSGGLANAQPPGNNSQNNWGLSAFDREFRSTTYVVYSLPNLMRNRSSLLKATFGGWQTSSVMTFQSGQPTTFLVSTSASAVKSSGLLTPALVPGATLSSIQGSGPIEDRLTSYYGSPGVGQPGSLFAVPPPTSFGGLGRGLPIRSPGQKSVDFVLSKITPIHESTNVEFRAEFFNVFNWVNFGAPDPDVSDAGFGIISSTTVAPRIIQLALKVNF
jgi:hypothetical protein